MFISHHWVAYNQWKFILEFLRLGSPKIRHQWIQCLVKVHFLFRTQPHLLEGALISFLGPLPS